MEIKIIKDHHAYKLDDVVNIPNEQANYLIRCGIAVEYIVKKKSKK
jgi:hypothetical protein